MPDTTGVAVGEGEAVGDGVGVAVGDGLAVGVGEAVGDDDAVGVGVALDFGVGVGLALEDTVARTTEFVLVFSVKSAVRVHELNTTTTIVEILAAIATPLVFTS